MGSISLVDEMLGLEPQAEHAGVTDFATSIAASNGMLIPLELLVQSQLSSSADHHQAELLKREFRQKSRLLDTDRRILACVCDILVTDSYTAAPAVAALSACIAALAPAQVPRVLAATLDTSVDILAQLLAQVAAEELILRVSLDSSAQRTGASLRALRVQQHTRVMAVLYDNGALNQPAERAHSLSDELTRHVDLVCLLPLLLRAPVSGPRGPDTTYLDLVAHLERLGLRRVSPGLYAPPHAAVPRRAPPWLNRIMASLSQTDVLGLGPSARSGINEMRFRNHTDPAAYVRDVAGGGNGIVHTYATTPVEQFVETLLVRLASGALVDVPTLAVRCQCDSPPFMDACERALDELRATGAVSGMDARRVMLKVVNDAWLPEVRARLVQLRSVVPAITRLANR